MLSMIDDAHVVDVIKDDRHQQKVPKGKAQRTRKRWASYETVNPRARATDKREIFPNFHLINILTVNHECLGSMAYSY